MPPTKRTPVVKAQPSRASAGAPPLPGAGGGGGVGGEEGRPPTAMANGITPASGQTPLPLGSTAAIVNPKLDLRELAKKMRADLPANWIHRGERHKKGLEQNVITARRTHNKSSRLTGINSLRLEDGVRVARCQRIVAKMQKQELKEVALAKEADQELTFNEDVNDILQESKTKALMEMNLHLSFASRPKMLANALFSWQGNLEWSKLDEDVDGLPGGPFEWPQHLKDIEVSVKQEVQRNQSALKIKLGHVDDMPPGLKKRKALAEWQAVELKLHRRRKDLMGVLRYETKKWLREDATRRPHLPFEPSHICFDSKHITAGADWRCRACQQRKGKNICGKLLSKASWRRGTRQWNFHRCREKTKPDGGL